jgi:hypothetical protein
MAVRAPGSVVKSLPYTEKNSELPATDMAIAWTKYITQTTVLRVMQSGFALVLLLLGAACVIAIRGTHAIQTDADTIAREELTIARLLNEVQAEEMTITAVLHRLIDGSGVPDSATLLRELAEADEAVTRAAMTARRSPEARQWSDLDGSARGHGRTWSRLRSDSRLPRAEPSKPLTNRKRHVSHSLPCITK